MSDSRSRSGSNANNRPSDLLAPSTSAESRLQSSGRTSGTLSIASYYYDNHASVDSEPSSPSYSPAWPPNFDNIASTSSRQSPTNGVTNASNPSLVHRRTSSVVQRDASSGPAATGQQESTFSGWASGLQLNRSLGEGSPDLPLQQLSYNSNPLHLSDDERETTPRITLSQFPEDRQGTPAMTLGDDIFERYRHERDDSFATEGDMGQFSYGQLNNANDSVSSLPMGRGGSYNDAGTLPGSPNTGGMLPLNWVDETDAAALTSNQTAAGYDRYGNAPMLLVQSPDDNQSLGREGRDSYFAVTRDNGPSLRTSPNELEDGESQTRPMQSSSGDVYAHLDRQARLNRARSGFDRVGKSLRRISRRVINLGDESAADAKAGHVRLPDVDDDDEDEEGTEGVEIVATLPDQHGPITPHDLRGKSLGIFGPTNPIRRGMARMMLQPWVEPLILLLIIFNVVLLILQSAPNVFVKPRLPGFFDDWIDYALLAVFSLFTFEVAARIIVSGLFINPPARVDHLATKEQSNQNDSEQRSVHSVGHRRRKASRSNTLDTIAVMGESIKSRANEVFRPAQMSQGSTAAASRTLQSSIPEENGEAVPTTASARSGSKGALHAASALLLEKSPFAKAIVAQRTHAADYAYLRHSFNRIDLVAVVSFWIMFVLAIFREENEPTQHIFIFRALSVLRAARLLTITSGTSTILHSLKMASPLLVNVAFFTLFSMLLFSIIGIQAFKGSYRRSCVWIGDLNPEFPNNAGNNFSLSQICGGYVNMTGAIVGAVDVNSGMDLGSDGAKGYICPMGQICLESNTNPNGNTESFDNIFDSLLQVIIVISSNGWSTIMYNMIDADYFSSFLYFVIGLIIMNFWMANLFVAVVINTFASITAETKHSAFAAKTIGEAGVKETEKEQSTAAMRRKRMASVYKRVWGYTKLFWVAFIIVDLGLQASQANHQANVDQKRLADAELYFTIVFDAEILLRFLSYLLDNDWRGFSKKKRNMFDVFLAVVTTISQAPVIKTSPVYAWLTVFQLARFYRVIIAVPRMETLLVRVFGSLAGLVNMIIFLFLIVGLATLIAVQLFRGDIPAEEDGEVNEINFKTIFNGYLGMYQLFSSENWTTVLYAALTSEGQFQQAVIAGIFLCGWFLFANFIVLQMFIAVIAENFGVAESQKRAQQLEMYLRKMEKPEASWAVRFLHHLSPYRWLRERNQKVLDGTKSDGRAKGAGIAQKAIDALDEKNRKRRSLHSLVGPGRAERVLNVARKLLRLDRPEEQVPLDTLRARQFRQSFSGATMLDGQRKHSIYDTLGSVGEGIVGNTSTTDEASRLFARDRQLTRLRTGLGLSGDEALDQAEIDELHANRHRDDPRIAQARLINFHPSYEKSLWIFSNTNRFRRVCQSVVPPSYGERLFGRQTSRVRRIVYQSLIFGAVAASVAVAGVATPAYRKGWYARNGLRRDSWFSITEVSLSIFFILEFFLKVVADGFAFTPNAYLMSPWNALDLFVLLTLVVNVSTELAVIGGVSRFTRALKAFRALRLINLSDLMRRAFSSLVAGAGKFFDVSVLAILYIVPFAIWGQNLFSGLLYSCTDTSSAISSKVDCLGEYSASPSEWSFLAPRVWQNPTSGSVYSFDDFKSSLLILFEIVSLEGWTNVMATAMSVTGRDQQLQTDARQVNAIFFVVYNLIGAIFVLTLFVAVIIENFQEFSGAAYLTTAQRQWIDLKRLIARQRPSKRPKTRPRDPVRSWCYDRAVNKHGLWARFITLLYIGSLITLATQQYRDEVWVERVRDIIYVSFTVFFALDIVIRLFGLGWQPFRSDLWNLFDLFVVTGTLATTIPLLNFSGPISTVNIQVQKIFLTAVAFKLVQRSNALNQLFKTAVASLPSIASLFLLWLVMFLVWGIMLVEVFGLTAWGTNETYQKNFWTLGGALVFLSLMSTGEGWNSYMHDFTLSPPLCTPSSSYLESDCGSTGWAYFLFIGWNVISMYIFLNMFTGTVVENFSYVFQLGGKPKLSREQVRNFKQAWALHDVHRSGHMPRSKLVGFFNHLSGVLDVRVHPNEASLGSLKRSLTTQSASSLLSRQNSPSSPLQWARGKSPTKKTAAVAGGSDGGPLASSQMSPLASPTEIVVDGLNISQLNKQLASLDYTEIRRNKQRFERLYQEACLIAELPANVAKGGIPFHDMMILVSHYKLIDDDEALSLEELVERRAMQERIDDRIQTEQVRGMLRLVWLRRRYLALRAEQRRLGEEWQMQHRLDHPSPAQSQQSSPGKQKVMDAPTIHLDRSASASGPSSSRMRPALSLDMQALRSNAPFLATSQGAMTPPRTAASQTQRLSPSVNSRVPSIHLTTSEEDGGRAAGEEEDLYAVGISPSPSLKEVEKRATPLLDKDDSAWVAISKRISTDASRDTDREGSYRDGDRNG